MGTAFRAIRSYGRHSMVICLFVCSIMLSSCDSAKKEAPGAAKPVPQQFSGTLRVKILPDAPSSSFDLRALYSGDKGVSFSWERDGVLLKDETTPNLSRRKLAKGARITVTVRAGKETGSAMVVIGNASPQVISIYFEPAVVYTGVDIIAKPDSIDPDGDDIRYDYQWSINNMDVSDNSPVLKGDKLKKGDKVTLVVTPSDGEEKGTPFKANVATVSNASPFFISTPPENFNALQYSYRASAKDPDGDKITYSLASAPGGMTIDPVSGMINWRISNEDAGSHSIEVVASDPEGAKSSQKYSLNIRINSGMSQ
jgi:hypothetical protein